MSVRESSLSRRKRRVRVQVKRSANGRPRLTVFRSNMHIHAQLINDDKGETLIAASSLDKKLALKRGSNIEAAKAVGKLIAELAVKSKITEVVFDRGSYIYHGRVKALAESARENGLKF
jgi:large subunit ribosomal protein L18